MKYLVTGGAGFIGSHLLDCLISKGDIVVCIDDLSSGITENMPISDNLHFINTSIQNIGKDPHLKGIKGIFHLAAQASVPFSINNLYESSSNNFLSTLKVWSLAKEMNVPIVFASSSAVYGNLALGDDEVDEYDILSPYAQDKLTMEHYAKMCWNIFKVSSIGLRLFNVYGPRQDPSNPYSGVISIFIDRLLMNKNIFVNGGFQTRDFLYVKDVVKTLIHSMEKTMLFPRCDFFNIGTGISTSINDLLSIISKILKLNAKIILKDLPVGDPEKSEGTFNKLKEILDIDCNNFISLEDGLIETIEDIYKTKQL